MKKMIVMCMMFGVITMITTSSAFADKPCVKTSTITVPVTTSPDDQKEVLPTPCPGENLTVVVQVPVKKEAEHKVTYTPTTIVDYKTVVQKGSDLVLDGGFTMGIMFPGHPSTSFGGGLVGEIGKKDSMWRTQVAFDVGSCQGSSTHPNGVSLNPSIAVMGSMGDHLRIGPAVNLFYCSDISAHPREKADERLAGPSFNAEFRQGHFSVTASVGAGVDTKPIPGGRKTSFVPYAGLGITLWFGK